MSLIQNSLHHISNEFITGGIHKAFLIDNNGDLRVFIPEIHSSNMFEVYSPGSKFNVNESKILENFNTYPKPMWNVPNEEAMKHETPIHPCWVTFENNSIQRPVIMGWCGDGIMYHASDSDSSGNSSRNSSRNSSGYYDENGSYISYNSNGNWITGYLCTVYGNTSADDNGICGWNGLNYRTISGCHVAIPMSCITGKDNDYPEFSNGYGTVLEVRNPKNGKTVVAVVADCGNFGKNGTYNKNAALDLPPNTQNALDIYDTQEIEYRVIGHISSWNGEQLKLEDFNISNDYVISKSNSGKVVSNNGCPDAYVYSAKIDGDKKIGNSFKVKEFQCKDGSDEILICPELVMLLEQIKNKCNNANISITSGYRTPSYNKSIGGASSSYHCKGAAADIIVSGYSATQVYNIFRQISPNSGGGKAYTSSGFTHVDVRYSYSTW